MLKRFLVGYNLAAFCCIMRAMFPYAKLRATVALVAVGLFCSFALVLPSRELSLGSLSFSLTGRELLSLILLGLTCTGVEAILRTCPAVADQPQQSAGLHWILPATLTVVAWALLNRSATAQIKTMGIAASSVVLALLVIGEYYATNLQGHGRAIVQLLLQLAAYLLATLLYEAIRLPSDLATALLVALASAVLSLRLICDERCSLQRVWPFALGCGASLGFVSWLLTLQTAGTLLSSLALVVLLYVLVGLVRHWLLGNLTRRLAIEYVAVGLAALLLLLSYAR